MTDLRLAAFVTIGVLVIAALPAAAATVTLTSGVIEKNGATILSETDTNIDASSTVNTDVGNIGAYAEQTPDGTSRVSTYVADPSIFGRATSTATAELTLTETNTFGAAQAYDFTFELFDLALSAGYSFEKDGPLSNPFADASSVTSGDRISYEVLLNDVSIFKATADLFYAGADLFSVANVSGFTYSLATDAGGFTGVLATASLDDLSRELSLGTFADGESFTIKTLLTSTSTALTFEGDNFAGNLALDPSSLGGARNQAIQPGDPAVAPVPLPAAGWLLMAGFGGLAALRRRKSRR